MTTPVEKRNSNKFCEFHGEVGHNTDECMHLKREIEELLKNGKLSHVIKELKQNSGKDQPKANKKGETSSKDKALAILMVQPRQRVARQRITQSFSPNPEISFPPLEEEEGGVLTLRISKIIPIECAAVSRSEEQPPTAHQAAEERIKLCDLLQRNLDVFAWKPDDMTDVTRHIAKHWLNIREGCPPVRQKRRSQAADRNQAIQEEVEKLVDACIMKAVHYHNWLSNPVMVKRHDDSWRMCVDFKDLNKACPKDSYPLPKIDWTVESLCGFPFKCFLDAYKGYHQIKMAKEDEDKTTFITSQGVFCYSKMPFGLRNARATYQRLVDKAFHKQIDRNLKVYADDLVIKIRQYQRNKGVPRQSRCCFKSSISEMFEGRTKAQWKAGKLEQTEEAEAALKKMKQLIAELPTLAVPEEKEELIIYLASAKKAGKILADFIVERPEKDDPDTAIDAEEELPEPWTLFTDGSSCADGSGEGLILTSPKVAEFTYALRFRFEATNNEAEYETLIAGLRIAEEMGVKNLQANLDSRLVANQVNGTYIAKEADMIRYLEKVRTLTNGFRMFSIKQVPRSENKKADALSKIASTSFAHLSKQVLVEELKENLINELEVLAVVEEEGNTWMTPIYEFLTEETLPAEVNKARAVWRRSQRFAMINEVRVAIDYFTKWIEAKPVATITSNQVKKIVWDNLVCRFRLPGEIISDNEKQFQDNPFKDWCEKAHRTMIKSSNGDTPFSLTYGTEAVIPAEIGMPTLRTSEVDMVQNNEALGINLDLGRKKGTCSDP
ncbi:reverse transcriptase domain-containing protein [Tanacetum coccineum]